MKTSIYRLSREKNKSRLDMIKCNNKYRRPELSKNLHRIYSKTSFQTSFQTHNYCLKLIMIPFEINALFEAHTSQVLTESFSYFIVLYFCSILIIE